MVLPCYGANFVRMGCLGGNSLFKKIKYHQLKQYSQQAASNGKYKNFIPFMDVMAMRRAQAERSILVQVQSADSYKELFSYCETMGKVQNAYHYSEGSEPLHFIIIEFASENDVQHILSSSTHLPENQGIPVTSQFLWFRAASRKMAKLKQSKGVKLTQEDSTSITNETNLKMMLGSCTSLSEQIEELYNITRLNEVGQRLRFLTAKQVESTLSGLFQNICAYPFGSSVNGFGRMGCDLDIVLRLGETQENEMSRLVYHCKAATGSERSTSQRNMDTVADLVNLFLPGCTQVRRILQARVPIIKYHQQFTNVECDLSMTNMSGVYMSDFLYIMGEIDPRVRPLIFTIRKWAKEVFVTNPAPGRWITNFSLTLLALAFLQKPLRTPPVLPTLNELAKYAGPTDHFVTEDGINCTFLRDIRKLNFKTRNTSSLESLLLEFFEYYAQFDFENKAICLNEAVSITKPEFSPLYIVNPLERGLNVSKNVSKEEVERFKLEVRNAAWKLESENNKLGLLSILETKHDLKSRIDFTFSPKNDRLMEISTLFDENEAVDRESEQIVYKNDSVQKEVASIKKETRQNIKSIGSKRSRQKSKR